MHEVGPMRMSDAVFHKAVFRQTTQQSQHKPRLLTAQGENCSTTKHRPVLYPSNLRNPIQILQPFTSLQSTQVLLSLWSVHSITAIQSYPQRITRISGDRNPFSPNPTTNQPCPYTNPHSKSCQSSQHSQMTASRCYSNTFRRDAHTTKFPSYVKLSSNPHSFWVPR